MAGGRPTKYSPEFGKLICERMAVNPVGWSTLENLYPDMPNFSTIKAWRHSIPEFSTMYLGAKASQAALLVEEIDELLPSDVRYYIDDKGNERIDAPSAGMLIAKINNRKWMAARLAPKLYGDKQQVDISANETTKEVVKRVADINKEAEKEY
jgi:hypothetical protein